MEPGERLSIKHFLLPSYEELSIYLFSLSIILILIIDSTVRLEAMGFISKEFGLIHMASIVGIICIFAGLILSVLHVFLQRDKTETEKIFMLYFAVFADIYIALNAASHIINFKWSLWLLLLPIWNGLNAAALLLRFYNQHEATSKVLSRNAALKEVAFGSLIVIVMIIIFQYVFNLYWSLTLSICLIYASTINNGLSKLLFERE